MISHYGVRHIFVAFNIVFLVMSITLFGLNVDRSLAVNKSEGWGWNKAQIVTKDVEGKLQETARSITVNIKDKLIGTSD